jgi:nucleotide-binding universal stress UspA family protein
MFHRILVGIDDSPAARLALERAIELAEAGRGRLGLLVSAPEPSGAIWAGPIAVPQSREGMRAQLENWAEKTVADAERAVPPEIPVTKLVTRGDPSAALIREVDCGEWDLVVVGQAARRRRLPFQRAVGERLRGVPKPVLVVHEEADAPLGRGAGRPSRRHPMAALLALLGTRHPARPSALRSGAVE